jgi:hypothetical protein
MGDLEIPSSIPRSIIEVPITDIADIIPVVSQPKTFTPKRFSLLVVSAPILKVKPIGDVKLVVSAQATELLILVVPVSGVYA